MSEMIKPNFKIAKSDWIFLLLVSLISLIQFIIFVVQNSSASYYDELGYYEISNNILINGLFNISDDLRTFLYPLLISILYIFTDGNHTNVKVIFSVFQFIVYIFTILMIAKVAYKFQSEKKIYFSVIAFGFLNPYLIQSTTLFLTDLLASCFLTISLIYLLTSDLNKLYNGSVVASFLYFSVLIRPSSAIFMVIFFIIAMYRLIKIKDFKPIKFTIVGLLLLIIFIPQLYMNITKFNHFTPLIHSNLFEQQSIWATQHLKYATVIIDGEQPGLRYLTPWLIDSNISMMKLMMNNFIVFILVFSSHLFGVLDWGYVDSFIRNLSVSTKILPSAWLYVQWFIIGLGMLWMWSRKNLTFVSASLILSALGYTFFIATTAVESRFGYPIYFILLFFSGYGVKYLVESFKNKRVFFVIIGILLVYIGISFSISYFIDMQTNRINWF
ncbi:hypothetical protein [Paenibacillus sinopodophylli]|uniref:hypothetical protein n=1 Tax=Paenibacillus sinopodophylli TaxID=1837342 RepID=UPI00110CD83C|nr:hypothetical protein [Paenibacillus sinopodophylli]